MDWLEILGEINYLAVIAGVVSSFVVGMIWYSESMFGKTWMKEVGLKKKEIEKDKKGMQTAMFHSAVATFMSGSVMAALMYATDTVGVADGAIFGLVIGLGIAMASMVPIDGFAKRSMLLTRINGSQDVVKYVVIGAIIGGIGF